MLAAVNVFFEFLFLFSETAQIDPAPVELSYTCKYARPPISTKVSKVQTCADYSPHRRNMPALALLPIRYVYTLATLYTEVFTYTPKATAQKHRAAHCVIYGDLVSPDKVDQDFNTIQKASVLGPLLSLQLFAQHSSRDTAVYTAWITWT